MNIFLSPNPELHPGGMPEGSRWSERQRKPPVCSGMKLMHPSGAPDESAQTSNVWHPCRGAALSLPGFRWSPLGAPTTGYLPPTLRVGSADTDLAHL